MMDHDGIVMFNSRRRSVLWRRQNLPIRKYRYHYKMLLTETFCGLLYWYPEHAGQSSAHATVIFNLALFCTLTGKEIYHERRCWSFCCTTAERKVPNGHEPRVAYNDKYVFVCFKQGGGCDACTEDCGKPGDLAMCVKVDANRMTCKARKTSSGLESALLAKTMLDASEHGDPRCLKMGFRIKYDCLKYLGFATDDVVVCVAGLEYAAVSGAILSSKIVFSINLERILKMYEPGGLFSAVHFVLDENIFSDCPPERMYRPHGAPRQWRDFHPCYQRTHRDRHGRARLAGFVQISTQETGLLLPKLYAFGENGKAKRKVSTVSYGPRSEKTYKAS